MRMFKNILLAFAMLFTAGLSKAEVGCYSADLIGPKLFTDVCWTCIFPIRVAGVPISGGGGDYPEESVKSPVCACDDNLGVPRPGITMSMWEPSRLIEFQRVSGCSSILNGIRFPFDRLHQGHHSNSEGDADDSVFMHYHYFAFPLLVMLDLFVNATCNPDGYMDMDVMYMSEVDPTWNNSELAFFTNGGFKSEVQHPWIQ